MQAVLQALTPESSSILDAQICSPVLSPTALREAISPATYPEPTPFTAKCHLHDAQHLEQPADAC